MTIEILAFTFIGCLIAAPVLIVWALERELARIRARNQWLAFVREIRAMLTPDSPYMAMQKVVQDFADAVVAAARDVASLLTDAFRQLGLIPEDASVEIDTTLLGDEPNTNE